MKKPSLSLGKIVFGGVAIAVLLAFGWYLSSLDGRIAIVVPVTSTPIYAVTVETTSTNTSVSTTPIASVEVLNPQAEEARAFAEPILTAITNRPPDYDYDFSEPEDGWITGSDGNSTRKYVDGEYVVIVEPNQGTGAGPGKDFLFSDFVTEVNARIISAADPGGWGFIFREQPFPQSSRYHINFDNIGLSLFLDTGSYTDLFHLQGAPVQPAPEMNHLLVIAKGPTVAIYVNDEPVTVVQDTTLSSGIVSLGIHAGDQETEVHIDDFKIWDISELTDSEVNPQAAQARAFAEPILQAVADKAPDFEDDFSTINPNWQIDTFDSSCGEIANGRLRISILPERMGQQSDGRYTCGAHNPNLLTVTNFVFEIDLTQMESEIQGFAGIQWRHTYHYDQVDDDGYYRVEVSVPGNHWVLTKSSTSPLGGTSLETLQEWQGTGSGRIRVVALGNQFAVYINEAPIFYLQDDHNSTGEIDLLLNAPDGPVSVEYDNVKLWNLDNVPGLP